MIEIDGSFGEGGGQIIRTALALSIITNKKIRIFNIRKNREKPGLLRQHLTALNAACEISSARVEGNFLKSTEFFFEPKKIKANKYHFSIGSAGSTTLVFQTLFPALFFANDESELIIEGGTHNSSAPPFDFLRESFFNVLAKMGMKINATIERYGFYPKGGGKIRFHITPIKALNEIELVDQEIKKMEVISYISKLPDYIAKDEIEIVSDKLSINKNNCYIKRVDSGPGNVLVVKVIAKDLTNVFTSFGVQGIYRAKVAENVINQVKNFLSSKAVVDEHLADQLLLPMCLCKKGKYRTTNLTMHTKTNIEIIKEFIDIDIQSKEIELNLFEILIGG